MTATPIPRQVEWHEKLRVPFLPTEIGKLPRAGIDLLFVGHAAITGRLLDVDPAWNWEPVAVDEDGLPIFLLEGGKPVGFWIRLTVCGVTRLGFGSCPPNQFDAVKVLVGDALRNAAMRFGVALDLWVKGSPELPQEQEPERPYMSGMNVAAFVAKCAEAGCFLPDRDDIVAVATSGRTSEPTEVYADEVTALRAAFERWLSVRKTHEENLAALAERKLAVPPGEDKVKPGKSVPKRPLPPTTGIEDVKPSDALL